MTVAIVGLGCRLPRATGPDAFFDLVRSRGSAVAPLPPERWDPSTHVEELPAGGAVLPQGCLIEDLPLDWRALRLPPLDAERMHRLERAALGALMQCIADAALPASDQKRARTRIFIAATTFGPDPRTDHSRRIRRFELQAPVSAALERELPSRKEELDDMLEGLFNLAAPPIFPESLQATASLCAGRVAMLFDYSGGHFAIDGGLASGAACLQQACAALEDGACDVALVCGVSPLLSPSVILSFAHRGFMARGHHAPFDKKSTGAILGEGAVALALVRAADSSPDDAYAHIAAVETATAPSASPDAIARAVQQTADRCSRRVPAARIKTVETRAAGVPEHDFAVAAAIAKAHERDRPKLSSSVANVGLLPSSAGLVGVLRAALSFRAGYAPAHTRAAPAGAGASSPVSFADVDVPLGEDAGIVVSDAGLDAHVGHAIITSPRAGEGSGRFRRAPAPGPASSSSREGSGPLPVAVPGAGSAGSPGSPGSPGSAGSASSTVAGTSYSSSVGGVAGAEPKGHDVAVVGLGVIAPGASDVRSFWRLILERHDRIGDLPSSRFDVDRFVRASADMGAILRTRLAAPIDIPADVLDDAEEDPTCWLARRVAKDSFADAGGALDVAADRIGVYFGQLPFRKAEAELEKRVLFAGHLQMTVEALLESGLEPAIADRIRRRARAGFDAETRRLTPAGFEAATSFPAAHRAALAVGAAGPVVSVDAACASTMAAVGIGVAALRRGQVDIAVCGGVAFNLLPEYYVSLSVLGVLSPRAAPPFSTHADGFVPGEGAGCLVLMRTDDAERAGRRVRAVIRGVGSASDGRSPSVYVPRLEGQVAAMRRALADAGAAAADVDLIEAHGTGTRAGDDCELKSYAQVYGTRDPLIPATLGAIKSQIGHLSSAAGAVGLIKAALALEERVLPPSLFDEERHSATAASLELATVARPWVTRPGRPRRAAVSSFGLGGVNYHVILEEPVKEAAPLGTGSGPARGTHADRFEVALAPVSLPHRPRLFPVRGKRVLVVPDDDGMLAAALRTELIDRGARLVDIDFAPGGTQAQRDASGSIEVWSGADALTKLLADEGAGAVDAVIDLSAAGAAPHLLTASAELIAWCEAKLCGALARLRVLRDAFEAPALTRAYAVVTRMGDLGLLGSHPDRAGAAVLLGLIKGVKRELPSLLAKGIDVEPSLPEPACAALVLDELEDGNDRLECAYALGRRLVVHLQRRSPAATATPTSAPAPSSLALSPSSLVSAPPSHAVPLTPFPASSPPLAHVTFPPASAPSTSPGAPHTPPGGTAAGAPFFGVAPAPVSLSPASPHATAQGSGGGAAAGAGPNGAGHAGGVAGRTFSAGDVFLFTGGGRGIVFECALGLALAGGRAVVCGRTVVPGAVPWVALDDEQFAEHRRNELLRRRAEDRTLTPARFAQEFAVVEKQRELARNLERAQRAGADLTYVTCDVNDARQVRELVERVRASHGRIDGIVHGAMVEHSTALQKKTDAIASLTLRTKLAGFLHLVRATAEAPPHTFVSFGSGAGRFGNMGQSDYCAANNVLAAATAAAGRAIGPSTRFVTIDWTAWADSGAAVRSAELVKNLGLTTIRAHEGVRWFLHEITHGRGAECLICEERVLQSLKFLGETAEGSDERAVRFDDAGAVLVAGAWPLVDRLGDAFPGTPGAAVGAVSAPAVGAGGTGIASPYGAGGNSFVLERSFDVERDAFVQGHRLFGVPILPASFGVELVAEAAAVVCPGFSVVEVREFEVGVPTKLHRDEPFTLRMHVALERHDHDEITALVETRSDLVRHGSVLQRDRMHHRGRVLLKRARPPLPQHPIPELDSVERARSFFHLADDPIGLGPLYSRGEWVRLVDDELSGIARPPRQREAMAITAAPCFAADPLMLDTAWQLAANWDGLRYGNYSVPLAVGLVRIGRQRQAHEPGRVHARVVEKGDDIVRYDVMLVGDNDDVLLETRGLVLKRVGKGSAA